MNPFDMQVAAARRQVEIARAELLRLLTLAVVYRDGTACRYCERETIISKKPCPAQRTVDHVLPVSKGGKDELDNLVLACRSCNSAKGVSLHYGLIRR
jgi:CRISPR/Cas system Type II protein with McrA/HNH and RuvC-like nuclease domain